jgi:hypothetical protein
MDSYVSVVGSDFEHYTKQQTTDLTKRKHGKAGAPPEFFHIVNKLSYGLFNC